MARKHLLTFSASLITAVLSLHAGTIPPASSPDEDDLFDPTVTFRAPQTPKDKPDGTKTDKPGWGGLFVTFSGPITSATFTVKAPDGGRCPKPMDAIISADKMSAWVKVGGYNIPVDSVVSLMVVAGDSPTVVEDPMPLKGEPTKTYWINKKPTSDGGKGNTPTMPTPEPSTLDRKSVV